jgi:hypothetical protein
MRGLAGTGDVCPDAVWLKNAKAAAAAIRCIELLLAESWKFYTGLLSKVRAATNAGTLGRGRWRAPALFKFYNEIL